MHLQFLRLKQLCAEPPQLVALDLKQRVRGFIVALPRLRQANLTSQLTLQRPRERGWHMQRSLLHDPLQ